MRIDDFVWLPMVVDKIENKHAVMPDEVEEIFASTPLIRLVEKGRVEGENLYTAFGRTFSGRYLTVIFIHKRQHLALVVTARDMDAKERKYHAKHKGN